MVGKPLERRRYNNNNNNNTQLVTRHMSAQCMAESQPRTGNETSDGTTVHIDTV